MTTAKLDLLEPANYNRTLKTELKNSDGQVAPLRYIYNRSDKQPAVIFIGPVGAGMVTLMKKADSGIKVLSGWIAETEQAIVFAAGSQLTDKVMKEELVGASIRKPVARVKDVQEALDKLAGKDPKVKPGKPAPSVKAPAPDEGALVEKAKKAYEALKGRKADALKRGPAKNHADRLKALEEEYADEIKAGQGKAAVTSVVGIGKVLDLMEDERDLKGQALEKRIKALENRRDAFKPLPLHVKDTTELRDHFDTVRKAIAATEPLDLARMTARLDKADEMLDKGEDQQRLYKEQKSDHEALVAQIAKHDRAAVARTDKKPLLVQLEEAAKKLVGAIPKSIQIADRYDPFGNLISVETKLEELMAKALEGAVKAPPDLTTTAGRKKHYVYNKSQTWVMNPVVYKNGTSSSSMTSQQLDQLSKGQLKSNTTAGGSVLKVGFEGHVHINGGSGGMAFVYVLDAEYKVTPTVVDTADSRGNNKDKNKYAWNTGGALDYFPPNARY